MMSNEFRLIDSHAHLNFEAFTEIWESVLARSVKKGVEAVIVPSSQYSTSVRAVELAKRVPKRIFAAIGLHPIHITIPLRRLDPPAGEAGNSDQRSKEDRFEEFEYGRYLELAKQPEVVAIGEVGIDIFRFKKSDLRSQNDREKSRILEEQERVLGEFIKIAQGVKKPLILHCRGQKHPRSEIRDQKSDIDPYERLIEIFEAIPTEARPRFVVHCYQGTIVQAEQFLALGGIISFTGTITYPPAGEADSDDPAVTELVRMVPLDRIIIETDSPYLSPVPYRGEQNEPWKVVEVARRIAKIKNLSLEEVASQTTQNSRVFFKFNPNL